MENLYDPSYYRILCLEPNATAEQIRSAYRGMMKIFHEDINQDDPEAKEKSQRINAAHEVLSNPASKMQYDQELRSYLRSEELKEQQRQSEARAKKEEEQRKKRREYSPNKNDAEDGIGALVTLLFILALLLGGNGNNKNR